MTSASYLELGWDRVALAACLLLITALLSLALRLGLGRRLIVAAARMVLQLLLIGLVLEWLFEVERPLPILALTLVMAGIAGFSAVRRTRRRFPGVYLASVVSVAGVAYVVTGVAVLGVVDVEPIWDPQYVIPLLGMLLGNALTGISLGLDRFLEGLTRDRAMVETLLAHGGTQWEAARWEVRQALRSAMIPTINSMMVMGIVSLPGMMTGQILAGAEPLDAVRYQIVILFMIAATVALATLAVVLYAFRVLLPTGSAPRFDRIERVMGD